MAPQARPRIPQTPRPQLAGLKPGPVALNQADRHWNEAMPVVHFVMVGDDIGRGDMCHLAGIDEILDSLGALIRRHFRRGLDPLNPLHGVVGCIFHDCYLSFLNERGDTINSSNVNQFYCWLM